MKKLNLFLTTLALIVFFCSCSDSASKVKNPEFVRIEPMEDTKANLKSNEGKEPKAKVECKKQEKSNESIKICKYGNIETKTEGFADMKGRFSYGYSVMLNGKKVKNEEIFNDKLPELLNKLNQKILKDYTAFYNAEDTKDCFEAKPKNPKFSINDMGIDFEDDKINFNVIFGLSEMCMSVDGTIISISLDEIEPYLKK